MSAPQRDEPGTARLTVAEGSRRYVDDLLTSAMPEQELTNRVTALTA